MEPRSGWNSRPQFGMLESPPAVAMAVLLAGAVSISSCAAHQQLRVFNPPPAPVRVVVETQTPELPSPPEMILEIASFEGPVLPVVIPPPIEPAPRPPQRPPVASVPKPSVPTVIEPSTVAPKPVQILSAAQVRENRLTLDENMERVRKALITVGAKSLTKEQNDIAEQVKNFYRQAEQAREQDLLTAVSFAKRADLLAKDLLSRLP